jgi:hypothetical protein
MKEHQVVKLEELRRILNELGDYNADKGLPDAPDTSQIDNLPLEAAAQHLYDALSPVSQEFGFFGANYFAMRNGGLVTGRPEKYADDPRAISNSVLPDIGFKVPDVETYIRLVVNSWKVANELKDR